MLSLRFGRASALAFAVLLAFGLVACEEPDEGTAPIVTTSDVVTNEALAAPVPNELLDQTIAAFQSGITTLSPDAALGNIDAWIDQFADADDATLQAIASDLRLLRLELTSATLDGPAIGDLLVRLGRLTQISAVDAGDNDAVATLGSLLKTAGRNLGGATEETDVEAVAVLLETDPTEISLGRAAAIVDAWENRVRAAEFPNDGIIAADLAALEAALLTPPINNVEAGGLLVRLGANTVEASDYAEEGTRTVLVRLGQALETFGEAVGGM